MRALLVGAGHAHLEVIASAAELARAGCELTVLAPGPFWYSGLAPAVLAGQHPPEAACIDVAALVERGGGRFVRGLAARLQPAQRRVELEEGAALGYDVLSLDVGSGTPSGRVPGLAAHGLPVKPISNLPRLRAELEARASAAPGPRESAPERSRGVARSSSTEVAPLRVVVVGAGVSGCEVAATLEQACARLGLPARVTIVGSSAEPAPRFPRGMRERLRTHLLRRGIQLCLGGRATRVEAGALVVDGLGAVGWDVLVDATGLRPPPLLGESGLPVDQDGALVVDRFLRSPADARVFGGGDCIAFQGCRLMRSGVHAVRQAPILRHNLLATLQGRELRAYRPQRHALLIVNLGDGTGLASWGQFSFRGALAYAWKDRIDRRFLASYA